MKTHILGRHLLCFIIATMSAASLSDSPKPTCNEQPSARDCIRVEDPGTTPPNPNVNKKKNRPVQLPVVTPTTPAGKGPGNAGR